MSAIATPGRRSRTVLLLPLVLTLAACDSGDPAAPPEEPVGFSIAYDLWTPSELDTCPPEVHNRYSVVGPDGLLYPTWHPPVDPETGCTFGHEHGRDPRGSDLYGDVGAIPFGYANQELARYSDHTMRHEDHVGHKIEWENDVEMRFRDGLDPVLNVHCDILVKLHQGTHSKDAFTNNLHELAYHIRCTDGTRMHVTLLTAIGTPGELVASCDRDRTIHVGTATPPNSPDGGGKRAIPDRLCIEQHLLVPEGERSNYHRALRESWETNSQVRTADNRVIARFNPYFQVFFPSRFFEPSAPDGVGRVLDACLEDRDGERARGGRCEELARDGALPDLAWDEPGSPFRGVRRQVDINSNLIRNAGGPEVWFTDPFGRNGRTEPFEGSIRQFVASIDNRGRNPRGPTIGRDRDYGGPGVHAPN